MTEDAAATVSATSASWWTVWNIYFGIVIFCIHISLRCVKAEGAPYGVGTRNSELMNFVIIIPDSLYDVIVIPDNGWRTSVPPSLTNHMEATITKIEEWRAKIYNHGWAIQLAVITRCSHRA